MTYTMDWSSMHTYIWCRVNLCLKHRGNLANFLSNKVLSIGQNPITVFLTVSINLRVCLVIMFVNV